MALLRAAVKNEEDPIIVNFKVTKEEKRKIMALAKKYAGGNMSLWLRYAGVHCIPRKVDTVAS